MRQITFGKLQFTVNQVMNMEAVTGLKALNLEPEALVQMEHGLLSLVCL